MKSSQIKVGQYTIHYLEAGQGFPLIFLHGFLADSLAWTELVSELCDHYRCISIDLLGFGHSSKPDIPFSISSQVSVIRSIIESLALDNYALVGHSMGGWIATAYALQFQTDALKHLVLLAPAGIRDEKLSQRYLLYLPLILPGPWVDIPLALFSPFLEAIGFQVELQQLAKIRRYMKKRPKATAYMFDRLTQKETKVETVDHRLQNLHVPTLVVAGKQDSVIPYAHAKTYAAEIAQVELLSFQEAKHNLHITHAPQIADRLIQLEMQRLERNDAIAFTPQNSPHH